jgi:gamma-glutamyltranspeptidase/glutathione hydrolase
VWLAVPVLVLSLACSASLAAVDEGSRFRPAVSGKLGVVATESLPAARAGRRVLERGGNAVDAAVTTAFTVGVSRPQSCGIGGGGFMVYRGAGGRTAALDFRETAPAGFDPQTLQGPGLHKTFSGHLSVGVPGTVAGLDAALERYGTISLAEAIRPAVRLARRGLRVPQSLSTAMEENLERLKLFPEAAQQYLVDGERPFAPGSRLRQPELAETLKLIAREGPDAFYRGRIARLIVEDMERTRANPIPGDAALMTRSDLASYRPVWRRPLLGSFRGRRIVAMPPPTSGGIAVLEMLNVLERFDLRAAGQSSADALHLIAEAQKLAWADRGEYVADPDFVDVPTRRLISKRYAASRRTLIDPERASAFEPGLGPYTGTAAVRVDEAARHGTTTHISVVDARGNAVALTCTIEAEFGSGVIAPGTGFLLNNELTDFGAPGSANEARGGKRPRSSMSPTIAVQGGRPIVVAGGAGGSRIIMGTFFAVLNRIEFGLPLARAVDAARIDAQREPAGATFVEDARIDPAVIAELERRGHTFERLGEYGIRPRIQAAGYRTPWGRLKDAVSDPRTDAGSLAQRFRWHWP